MLASENSIRITIYKLMTNDRTINDELEDVCYHSEPQLLQCHCLCTFLENIPHMAMEPALEIPLIFLMLVLLHVGQCGVFVLCVSCKSCFC